MAGTIHWGRKKLVTRKQEAWRDVDVYEVPFSGKADLSAMTGALTRGKNDKRPKPWLGACGDVCVTEADNIRSVAIVEVSFPIGD